MKKQKISLRKYIRDREMKLVRLRITNLDPKKKDLPGEISLSAIVFSALSASSCLSVKSPRKAGMSLLHLQDDEAPDVPEHPVQNVRTANGTQLTVRQGWVKEFALEVLPRSLKRNASVWLPPRLQPVASGPTPDPGATLDVRQRQDPLVIEGVFAVVSTELETYSMAVTFTPVDIANTKFVVPTGSESKIHEVQDRPSIDDVSSGAVDGSGIFDVLMRALKSQLQQEFEEHRITGSEYTRAYIELTQSALSASMQFLTARDASFWASGCPGADHHFLGSA